MTSAADPQTASILRLVGSDAIQSLKEKGIISIRTGIISLTAKGIQIVENRPAPTADECPELQGSDASLTDNSNAGGEDTGDEHGFYVEH